MVGQTISIRNVDKSDTNVDKVDQRYVMVYDDPDNETKRKNDQKFIE